MTKKKKQLLMELIFPLATQAIHNAMRTLSAELKGTWYKFPDGTLTATLLDCRTVMNMLSYVGLNAPQHTSESSDRIIHINIENPDLEMFMEEFSYENMQMEDYVNKKAMEFANKMVKEKIKSIKKELLDAYSIKVQQFKLDQNNEYIQEQTEKCRKKLEIEYARLFVYKLEEAKNKIEQIMEKNRKTEKTLNQKLNAIQDREDHIQSMMTLIFEIEKYFDLMYPITQKLRQHHVGDNQIKELYHLNGVIRQNILKLKAFQKEIQKEEGQ